MKIKILCLHGLKHNALLMEKSMSTLIKKFKKDHQLPHSNDRFTVEFDFYDSPIKFEGNEKSEFNQWWSATRENALTISTYDTLNESIENIRQKWNNYTYNGIMGFSQGSVVAQIFQHYIESGKIMVTHKPMFMILCATSLVSDKKEINMYEMKKNIPTILMIGETDPIVSSEQIKKLDEYFINNYKIIHKGGHYVSSTSDTYKKLYDFFIMLHTKYSKI